MTEAIQTEKMCSKCKTVKPLDEYNRRTDAKDGRQHTCKTCLAEYRSKNREAIATYKAEYRAAKPQSNWESEYRRRCREYGFVPVVNSFTRTELIDRWGNACVHCGGPFEQLDHYPVPVVHGGAHTLENCKPVCAPCNHAQSGFRRRTTAA